MQDFQKGTLRFFMIVCGIVSVAGIATGMNAQTFMIETFKGFSPFCGVATAIIVIILFILLLEKTRPHGEYTILVFLFCGMAVLFGIIQQDYYPITGFRMIIEIILGG